MKCTATKDYFRLDNQLNQKPCFVNTAQGFSVSYKNKLLYSKYAPSKAIVNVISNLNVIPGTVFLALSPVLEYGLLELEQKLSENCIIICAEADPQLQDFEEKYRTEHKDLFSKLSKTFFLNPEELYNLPLILNSKSYRTENGKILNAAGFFKRIIPVEMSAGTAFHKDFYDQLAAECTNSLMTWWSNRITLTKFGRLYSKNYFSNLKELQYTTPVENYFNSVSKPIVIFGAGESFTDGISFINGRRNDFYILAVDTALQPLKQRGITPDGVFIEEAQFVISRAFLGVLQGNFHIFAGLSSIPLLSHLVKKENISYFRTLYSDAYFLNNKTVNEFLPPENNPFGSVGLTAVYYGLKFRKNSWVKVFICGLDFSYSPGLTHTKGTMAHTSRLLQNTRLSPVQNYLAAYNKTARKILSENNNVMFTTPAMNNYAKLFSANFSNTENLFNLGKSGINLKLPHFSGPVDFSENENVISEEGFSEERIAAVNEYLSQELNVLSELRDLLSGKITMEKDKLNKRITEIAEPREYLYLHFPDGERFSTEISFLKRIRSELDFFIKILK